MNMELIDLKKSIDNTSSRIPRKKTKISKGNIALSIFVTISIAIWMAVLIIYIPQIIQAKQEISKFVPTESPSFLAVANDKSEKIFTCQDVFLHENVYNWSQEHDGLHVIELIFRQEPRFTSSYPPVILSYNNVWENRKICNMLFFKDEQEKNYYMVDGVSYVQLVNNGEPIHYRNGFGAEMAIGLTSVLIPTITFLTICISKTL